MNFYQGDIGKYAIAGEELSKSTPIINSGLKVAGTAAAIGLGTPLILQKIFMKAASKIGDKSLKAKIIKDIQSFGGK